MRVRRCRIHIMRASLSGLMALLVLWFFPLNIFIHSFIHSFMRPKTRAHQFCDIDFISEIPLNGKINTCPNIGGVVNTGRPLQVKYWGVATPATPAALTPMAVSAQPS